MEDKIMDYGVFLGRRFSLRQKQQFLAVINEEFHQMGYETKVVTGEAKRKNVPMDLFVGSLNDANVIYAATYDTPAKVLWPYYHYYPFNGYRTFKEGTVPLFLPNILIGVLMMAVFVVLFKLPSLAGVTRMIVLAAYVFVALLVSSSLTRGIANRTNMNRNTSGVLALLDAASKMPENKRKKVAFVLLDGGCSDNVGANMLAAALPKTIGNKTVVLVDCISSEGNLSVGYKENNEREAREFASAHDGEMATFKMDGQHCQYTPAHFLPKCLVVSRGVLKNHDLVVEHTGTGKDNSYITVEQVEEVSKLLLAFVK